MNQYCMFISIKFCKIAFNHQLVSKYVLEEGHFLLEKVSCFLQQFVSVWIKELGKEFVKHKVKTN